MKLAWSLFGLLLLGSVSAAGAASLNNGMYSEDQALRGEAGYRARCSSCHAADLRGNSNSPGLRGIGFLFVWEGRTLGELFQTIRTSMPTESPGSLSEREYLDILAFLLEQNGYPVGAAELANASGELDTVVIIAP